MLQEDCFVIGGWIRDGEEITQDFGTIRIPTDAIADMPDRIYMDDVVYVKESK